MTCRHLPRTDRIYKDGGYLCLRCDHFVSREAIRRGRNNRKRGIRAEGEIAKATGGERIGHHGGKTDVRITDLFAIQSKRFKRFPYWMTRELDALPRSGGQVPVLMVSDTPGAGIRRQTIAVVLLEDWIALHGDVK